MKIQCKDGIFDTGAAEFSKYNADRMRLEFMSIGRADLRAGKPQYQTPCTVENARAVLDAQLRKEQRIAAEEAGKRAAWFATLTAADLLEMERVSLGANMMLPTDVQSEMGKRGLNARTELGSPEFSAYVKAANQAEREGRSAEFEDGIN